ncbi:MAG: multifunctional CCA tRNA nucleotidyl transferase/2'3'-cyclic phosphodiesterase/2'nucleotidase/phosphatase [Proteobacteria bacterium]|nr:multifunctional CCA tRNA nucleotidyl transferase/2'3'-cyclic phosphodiesterase/2'nucleotidase/phosphatase [Pseudomonadota bacterium]
MKVYEVGGAVRDRLLGLPVQDHDYVVVGATPEEMIRLGYTPVGRDFPVFLHPQTHEEYALARTERKTAPGYKGFQVHAAPDVTLEQDLARRDFTINAMARDADGTLIDPHGGLADLKVGVLRHVGAAFAEDPVRILRGARFAARFGFAIAPATLQLMRTMAASGEVDALVPERVWQELAKGLMEDAPARMFALLAQCGALAAMLPEAAAHAADPLPALRGLEHAAQRKFPLPVRFAVCALGLAGEHADALAQRVKAPGACRDLAVLAAKLYARIAAAETAGAPELVALLQAGDAFRRPERYDGLLDVCLCERVRAGGAQVDPWLPRLRIERALAAAAVNAGAIAAAGDKSDIAARVLAARVAAVQAALGGAAPATGA